MPASGDCELIRDGFLGQPVNALSSLAFVLVGLLLLRRRPVLGWAGVAIGLGSFLFHGPMPEWAEWAHDVTLAAIPLAVALEAKPRIVIAGSVVLAVLFGLRLDIAEIVTAILVIEAAVLVVARRHTLRRTPALGAVVLVGVGGLVAGLSRADGPWCDPDLVVQGHALWHLFGAAAVWLWSLASPDHATKTS